METRSKWQLWEFAVSAIVGVTGAKWGIRGHLVLARSVGREDPSFSNHGVFVEPTLWMLMALITNLGRINVADPLYTW